MKKTYSDFILNELDSSTAVDTSATKTDNTTNTTTTTETTNPDAPGEAKPASEQESDEPKQVDEQPDTSSSFDSVKAEAIIKEIHDFWINKVITENELNFSGNTLKILYVKQKNPKYTKYKETINEVINGKTADCQKRLDDSDVGDLFFYNEYPVKLEKKGLSGKPSIISFFERKNDKNYNLKIKEIIDNKEEIDSSNLSEYQKYLKLDEFELLTDIDENHTYMYEGQPVEFTFENGKIKTMVNADTNKSISLVDENGKLTFDMTKLKKYDESDKSNETTTTTTTQKSVEKSEETETKPAETKPAETKPAETKPAETKPAETKPAETKPAETKPAEAGNNTDKLVLNKDSAINQNLTLNKKPVENNSDVPVENDKEVDKNNVTGKKNVMTRKEFKNNETIRRNKNKNTF